MSNNPSIENLKRRHFLRTSFGVAALFTGAGSALTREPLKECIVYPVGPCAPEKEGNRALNHLAAIAEGAIIGGGASEVWQAKMPFHKAVSAPLELYETPFTATSRRSFLATIIAAAFGAFVNVNVRKTLSSNKPSSELS